MPQELRLFRCAKGADAFGQVARNALAFHNSLGAPALFIYLFNSWVQHIVNPMSDNIADLERQHKALEDEITEAMRHRSVDDLAIVELKRQKLHIKEAIERLRNQATSAKDSRSRSMDA